MKLIHLANFKSTNIGNGALIYGTERVLTEDLGPVEFLAEPWDDYTFEIKKFDQSFVDKVNNADGLLVGGAVAFNGRHYLPNTGFRLDLPYNLLTQIKKPIIFYGISYKFWPKQYYHHRDKLIKAMAWLLSNPKVLFAVRNDGCKPWLESLIGYQSDRIIEVPDPALFVTATDHEYPELVRDKPNVLLSLNNEDEVYRYGGRTRELFWSVLGSHVSENRLLKFWRNVPDWQGRKTIFLKRLARAIERLVAEQELNLILVPHYFDDYKTMTELIGFLKPRILHQVTISTGLQRVSQTEYFYGRYAKADLALSMRIHSMSPSIGLGTPMIPLISQTRMSDFLDNVGLQDIGVDIFDLDLADKVYIKARHALANKKELKDRFRNVFEEQRDEFRRFNKKVSELLGVSSLF
ncbi:MAG: polysaccharide pyruvyl transferase family protein [bacterium]|nr:polysaccharide pyruvyl transferase family protein [bacterium]